MVPKIIIVLFELVSVFKEANRNFLFKFFSLTRLLENLKIKSENTGLILYAFRKYLSGDLISLTLS
jgi:hypothetical protein